MNLWLLLGGLAYLSSSISTSLDKNMMNHHDNPLTTNMIKMFFDGIIILVLGFFVLELSWNLKLIISSIILGFFYAISGLFYFKSLNKKDVEEAAPLMISLEMLLIIIGAVIFLGEKIDFTRLIGIILILIGISFLVMKKLKIPKFDKGFKFILFTIIMGVIYSLLVKLFLKNVSAGSLAITMYFSASTWLLVYQIIKKKKLSKQKIEWKGIAISAIFGAIGTILLYLALQKGLASQVYPLVGLQPISIFLIATIFLKEKFTWQRLVGTIIIVLGIIFLSN